MPVRRLGYGAMRVTGPGIWGPPPDRTEAIATLRRAVELGITLIDTAESYGPFVSETLIAEALHPYPSSLVIATKAGLDRPGPDQWMPQSGWLHEPRNADGSRTTTPTAPCAIPPEQPPLGAHHRYEDELAVSGKEDRMAHVLFSTTRPTSGCTASRWPATSQLWTGDYRLLLDGPRAGAREIAGAAGVWPGGPVRLPSSRSPRCASAGTRSTGTGRSSLIALGGTELGVVLPLARWAT